MTAFAVHRRRNQGRRWGAMADTGRVCAAITPEMVKAGLEAYKEFLGDDRPIISDEKDLVVAIYDAMEQVRRNTGNL